MQYCSPVLYLDPEVVGMYGASVGEVVDRHYNELIVLYRGVTKRKTNIYRKRQIYIQIYIVHSFRQWRTLGGGGTSPP